MSNNNNCNKRGFLIGESIGTITMETEKFRLLACSNEIEKYTCPINTYLTKYIFQLYLFIYIYL